MNREMNPYRMMLAAPETYQKLRNAKLCKGHNDRTYEKTFGVHTHRLVAEKMIGRKLRKGEVVHHMDGNKRNNNPSNLKVFANQAEHARWHKEHDRKEVMPNEVHSTQLPTARG